MESSIDLLGRELEVAKTIYSNMREEILEKMRFSNQLLGYKLLSVGAVVGFVSANQGALSNLFLKTAAILVAIGLALCFDLALYQNNKAIISAGTYIREHIEPWLKVISNSEQVIMWEEYISRKNSKGRRMIYNIFESANYLMTLFLMTIASVLLWLSFPWLILVLLPLVAFEVLILFKGLSRQ